MSRLPNKPIKIKHANGKEVNYGPLVNGLIDGIKVLARKEILIMLKAQLVAGKVKYFANHTRLRVTLTDVLEASLYVVHEKDLWRLTEALKKRQRMAMRQLLLADRNGGVGWVDMPMLYPENVRLEKVQIRHRKTKAGGLKKLWLLVKRLFGKDKPEDPSISKRESDEAHGYL